MVTVIKQGSTRKQIASLLARRKDEKKRKGIDVKKYCGVIKLKEDPLTLQKQWRDEWE